MDFTALFVDVDDFWLNFQNTYHQHLLTDGKRHRHRAAQLSVSEMITILIAFQTSNYRTFKHFYLHLLTHHRGDFPQLTSYNRFVQRIGCVTIPLFAYLLSHCRGTVTGISFIDSTPLKVCSNKRTGRHRVFDGLATMGKSTMGWFFGFKLHLVINECGELLAFTLTPGNVDDRKPVDAMTTGLWGKLFGDKGYISQNLFDKLYAHGLKLVTNVRKNMANKLMDLQEKILLRKRSLIETINDQLKNVCQIEHTQHRSPANFLVHLMAGLAAYAKQPKKPSLRFDEATGSSQLSIA